MSAEITPTTGQDIMAKLAKSKIGLMLAIFFLFALLPVLAAAGASSTASTAGQLDYPCSLLPLDSQALYDLSLAPDLPKLSPEEQARQLAVYNWWRYCEQKSAPAWVGDNFGAFEFEYPDGGGTGQQPWASWRPELISTASLRSVRRERESPVRRPA